MIFNYSQPNAHRQANKLSASFYLLQGSLGDVGASDTFMTPYIFNSKCSCPLHVLLSVCTNINTLNHSFPQHAASPAHRQNDEVVLHRLSDLSGDVQLSIRGEEVVSCNPTPVEKGLTADWTVKIIMLGTNGTLGLIKYEDMLFHLVLYLFIIDIFLFGAVVGQKKCSLKMSPMETCARNFSLFSDITIELM